jgi:hypothetical protein
MNTLDKYLVRLNENFWESIMKFFESGESQHGQFRNLSSDLKTRKEWCRKKFKGSKLLFKLGSFSYEQYSEHPDFSNCIMKAELSHNLNLLKWLKRTSPLEICKYNLDKEKCMSWVRQAKVESSLELEQLQSELNKDKVVSKVVFNRVMKYMR